MLRIANWVIIYSINLFNCAENATSLKKMLCTIKFWVHLHTYKFMFSLQIAYLFLRINLVVRFASASLSSMIRRMASCQKFLRYSMGVTNNHPGRIYFGKKNFSQNVLLTFVYYSTQEVLVILLLREENEELLSSV